MLPYVHQNTEIVNLFQTLIFYHTGQTWETRQKG